MATKNVFISHRWDYEEDYKKIDDLLDRSKYTVSNRSVESSDPLDGTKKEITDAIKGKIDSASVILAPARPSSTTPGTMGRKELDYAISKSKKIIAVNTGTTSNLSTFWADNGISITACRKDSIENAIG